MTTSTGIPRDQLESDGVYLEQGIEVRGAEEEVVDLEQGTEVGAVEEQAAKYLTIPLSGATSKMPHPLHYACVDSASLEVIQYLVNKGGNDKLIVKDGNGSYPLHLACERGASLDVIQYLVNEGGKDTLVAKDNDGLYPLDCACEGELASSDVIKYLINLVPDILGLSGLNKETTVFDNKGYSIYARALVHAVRQAESPPASLCVGIYSHWGGDNSTLSRLIKKQLEAGYLLDDVQILNEFKTPEGEIKDSGDRAFANAHRKFMASSIIGEREKSTWRLVETEPIDPPTFMQHYIFFLFECFCCCRRNDRKENDEVVSAGKNIYNKECNERENVRHIERTALFLSFLVALSFVPVSLLYGIFWLVKFLFFHINRGVKYLYSRLEDGRNNENVDEEDGRNNENADKEARRNNENADEGARQEKKNADQEACRNKDNADEETRRNKANSEKEARLNKANADEEARRIEDNADELANRIKENADDENAVEEARRNKENADEEARRDKENADEEARRNKDNANEEARRDKDNADKEAHRDKEKADQEHAEETYRRNRIYSLIVGNAPVGNGNLAQWDRSSVWSNITMSLLSAVQTVSRFIQSFVEARQCMSDFCCCCCCKSNGNNFTATGATAHVTVGINAWAYSSADHLWASMMKEIWDAVEIKYGKTPVRMHRASIALAGEIPFNNSEDSTLDKRTEERKRALLMHRRKNICSSILFVIVATLALSLTLPSVIRKNHPLWRKGQNSTQIAAEICDIYRSVEGANTSIVDKQVISELQNSLAKTRNLNLTAIKEECSISPGEGKKNVSLQGNITIDSFFNIANHTLAKLESGEESSKFWNGFIASILAFLPVLYQLIQYFKNILPYVRKARGDYILQTATESSRRKDILETATESFKRKVKKELEYLVDFLRTTTYVDEEIGCRRYLRLCLFIDDLDRCPEQIVVSVLEAVILLLVDGPITCWMAIDSRVVVECIEAVKKDISGQRFLDKIVQLPFCLPNKMIKVPKRMHETVLKTAPYTDESRNSNKESVIKSIIRPMLNEDEKQGFNMYASFLDGNPRRHKRIINSFNVCRNVYEQRIKGVDGSSSIELTTTKLLKFVILLEQWPCRMTWLLQFLENVERNSVLERAPDHSTTLTISLERLKTMDAATAYKDFVDGLIYSSESSIKVLILDADPQLFEGLLKVDPVITVKDLALLSDGIEPRERWSLLRNYAFNLPISVTSKVSIMMDALSLQPDGRYCTKN